jgi:hypothetical protein
MHTFLNLPPFIAKQRTIVLCRLCIFGEETMKQDCISRQPLALFIAQNCSNNSQPAFALT